MIPEKNIYSVISTTIELPIKLVAHRQGETAKFKISIFYECFINGEKSQRDVNSDIPTAVWYPKTGIFPVNYTYNHLRNSGLTPILEKKCRRLYKQWKKKRKARKEAKKAREAHES